jgi:large subunit ribosomal protein L4
MSKQVELNKTVFGVTPNEHSMYLAIKSEMASKRQGTSKTKNRSEVRGTGSKPWKQKGTGRSRIGSIRNPSRPGGGTAFGPEPRTYSLKINKKARNVARKSILSSKVLNDSLMIVDKISLDSKKTKNFVQIIKNLGLESKKVTFLISEKNENAYKSSRNLHNVNMCLSNNVSNYDLANNDTIIIDQKSLEYFNKI